MWALLNHETLKAEPCRPQLIRRNLHDSTEPYSTERRPRRLPSSFCSAGLDSSSSPNPHALPQILRDLQDFLLFQAIRWEQHASTRRECIFPPKFHPDWTKPAPSSVAMGGWNRISGAGFFKPLAGVSLAFLPGAGAVYFLVGSALGFLAMLHASEPDVAEQWASAAHWIALSRSSPSAHHLFVAMSLVLLATRVWRLGKRCDAVEGRVRGVVCTACGTKTRPLKKKGSVGPALERVGSSGCSNKPVSRSLASELEQEAETEDEDNASEVNGAEEGNVEWLRRRLVRERTLKKAALEELEKERRAVASAVDEAMAKIACLRNEKALVEREARQFREMAQQKQMYDRQVIESLQWMINKFRIQSGEPEFSSERAVSETSEDDRDKRL